MALAVTCFSASIAAQSPVEPLEQLTSPSTEPPTSSVVSEPAPLVIYNRTAFIFRASYAGYQPADRVRSAAARIQISIEGTLPGKTSVKKIPEGIEVLVDHARAFVVLPGDVDTLDGQTIDSTAEAAAKALGEAITAAREQRSLPLLLSGIALAVVAAVLYLVLLRALYVGNLRVGERLGRAIAGKGEGFKVMGVEAVQVSYVLGFVRHTVQFLAWVLALLGTYGWLTFTFSRFAYTQPWGMQLETFLTDTLATVAGSIVDAIPGLVVVAIIVVVTRTCIRLSSAFFDRVAARRVSIGWLDADTAVPTRRVVSVLFWLFALAAAYPYLPGAQTDAFKGLSVLIGLMVSLGASGIVGQAASGLILIYTRTMRPGEFVKVGGSEGTVTEIGLFATRIDTGMGEQVVLPNALVLSNTTRNFSRNAGGGGFIAHTGVTISYATPWRQVHAMLLEAASRTPGILQTPPPRVIQTALSDFYVEYRLIAQGEPNAPGRRAETMSTLNASVQDVFNEYGVQIMSPHYRSDPELPQVVSKAKWYEAPAKQPTEK